MTVAELGERMSSAEFTEWMAYDRIDPFGEERADLRQAMTSSGVHNLLQAQTKKPKYLEPKDFMLFSDKPKEKPKAANTPEAMMAKFNALTSKKQR